MMVTMKNFHQCVFTMNIQDFDIILSNNKNRKNYIYVEFLKPRMFYLRYSFKRGVFLYLFYQNYIYKRPNIYLIKMTIFFKT